MGGKKDCQREVGNLFDKLGSWRDESHKQISDIINFHSSSINKGINDLVKEVGDLQAELSVTKKERNVLLDTVENLNGEIRHLSAKLPVTQPLPEPEDNLSPDVREEAISDTTEHYIERPRIESETAKEEECLDYGDIFDENDQQQILKSPENTSEDFVCSECNFVFSTQENLTIHLKNVHPKLNEVSTGQSVHKMGGKQFKCDQCPHTTSRKESLKRHIEVVHDKIKSHVCGECGYAFSRKDNLKTHRNMVHQMGEKIFKCDKCPYTSYLNSTLKAHIKGVHDKIKNHVCGECGYACSHKSNLNKHRNYCTGQYVCGECGYATSRMDSLKKHRDSAHNMGEKQFKCGQCPHTSSQKTRLKSHIEWVHDKIKRYVCEECGYASSDGSNLNKHRNTVHNMGEKKFKCDVCPYKSYIRSDLSKHVKRTHLST